MEEGAELPTDGVSVDEAVRRVGQMQDSLELGARHQAQTKVLVTEMAADMLETHTLVKDKLAQLEAMTEDEEGWVRGVLGQSAKAAGGVTGKWVQKEVRKTRMAKRFAGTDQTSAGDVIWAWVADQQREGDLPLEAGLARRTAVGHRQPVLRWQWYAGVRSGWDRQEGVALGQVRELERTDRVLAALWWRQEGVPSGEWSGQVLFMEKGTVRAVWQAVKTTFKGT